MRSAALFDVDGTLLDSNYLHTLAWRRAFLDCGRNIPAAAAHRRIGMGAGLLLRELLGDDEALIAAVKAAHRGHYDALKPELRAFDGARELLAALHQRGTAVVLATSADTTHELPAQLAALDAEGWVDAVTSGDDVDEAKPAPELFELAAARAGVDPGSCIVVGDTVWDVEAARRAGIGCVAVETGGIGERDLMAAGALAVYPDVAAILADLDTGPLRILW